MVDEDEEQSYTYGSGQTKWNYQKQETSIRFSDEQEEASWWAGI